MNIKDSLLFVNHVNVFLVSVSYCVLAVVHKDKDLYTGGLHV